MSCLKRLYKLISLGSIVLFVTGCGALGVTPTPASTEIAPISTATVTATPASDTDVTFLFKWPIPPLTNQQIASVKECDLTDLAAERYSDTFKMEDLAAVHELTSACDWATLALAYAQRNKDNDPLPESALEAYTQAVTRNSGFVLATPIFYNYFGTVPIVEAPPFTNQEITKVQIRYDWNGLGKPVNYSVDIDQATTNPVATIITATPTITSAAPSADKALVQALATALTDFFPVAHKSPLIVCFDNYPTWTVSLTFEDNTVLVLTTEGSNLFNAGGPWYIELEGQTYMQVSPAFVKAIIDLTEALDLPFGQPAATTCSSLDIFLEFFK